ncbi:MAG: hypothetical protein CVV53_09295, partial [Spirochaetae bacterium HGW-Spirochaetae-9]
MSIGCDKDTPNADSRQVEAYIRIVKNAFQRGVLSLAFLNAAVGTGLVEGNLVTWMRRSGEKPGVQARRSPVLDKVAPPPPPVIVDPLTNSLINPWA